MKKIEMEKRDKGGRKKRLTKKFERKDGAKNEIKDEMCWTEESKKLR